MPRRMGASGAGKTTLLNIIAQRVKGYSGEVTLNGRPVDASFRRICGYVTQDVPFLEFLTVRETLMYTARLRLPGSLSAAAKAARVDDVIALLDLTKCAHTRVGKAAESGGISGGERRRLALGCELLFDPHLIIADEVTSGLDSASALRIALILRRLARREGRTVIVTLHQPRSDVMAVFDQVMLLAQGRVAYYGPGTGALANTTTASTSSGGGDSPDKNRSGSGGGMIEYFASAGYAFPTYANPADVMLDLVNADHDALGDDENNDDGHGSGEAATSSSQSSSNDNAGASASEGSEPGEGSEAGGSDTSGATNPNPPAAGASDISIVVPPELDDKSSVSAPSSSPVGSLLHRNSSNSSISRRQAVILDLVAKYERSPYAAWALEPPPGGYPPPVRPSYADAADGNDSDSSSTDVSCLRRWRQRRYPTSWLTQAGVVAERAWWYKWRNPDAVMSQFIGSVVMAVIVGTVYLRLPLTGAGARDRMSAIAFILLTQSFVAFDQVILLPQERAVMLRDSESGAYSTGAFYWGRTAAEFPLHTLFAVFTAIITNYMFGLRSDARHVGVYILIVVLVTNAGAALLTLVGALSSSMAMGNGLATLVITFASLFNGFFINPANLHVVYRWIADVSFPAFGVRAATTNELSGLAFTCTAEEQAAAGCTGSGDDLLSSLGFAGSDVWALCGYLLAEIAVMRVVAFFALHFLYTGQSFQQRLRALF